MSTERERAQNFDAFCLMIHHSILRKLKIKEELTPDTFNLLFQALLDEAG
jgi:hypothetical protein